jgi:hypothetical protein
MLLVRAGAITTKVDSTMRKVGFSGRFLLILLVTASVGLGAYLFVIRPWFLHWGTSASEIRQIWPGDELSPRPGYVATRAVTIQAPAESVWRWVVQVGQDRAGFYSYSWLENIFLADMHNADRTVEEWQTRNIGDTVWLARKDRYRGMARLTVALLTPNRAMVMVSPIDYQRISAGESAGGSWAFILTAVDPRTTRLILRSRSGQSGSIWRMAYNYFVFDPAHFIMERKMMLGIKHRAEECMRWRTLYGCPGS